jgi:hypothetical protein
MWSVQRFKAINEIKLYDINRIYLWLTSVSLHYFIMYGAYSNLLWLFDFVDKMSSPLFFDNKSHESFHYFDVRCNLDKFVDLGNTEYISVWNWNSFDISYRQVWDFYFFITFKAANMASLTFATDYL